MDISNYLAYLNSIHAKEASDSKIPVTILGFSQGAATATRWALQGNIPFQRLVLWAGIFPPDMDFEAGHKILEPKEVVAVYGKHDPFLTPARIGEMKDLSDKLGIKPRTVEFDGKHEVDELTLRQLI
jgi:predicted esterase